MYEDDWRVHNITPEIEGMYHHMAIPVPQAVDHDVADIDSVLQANVFMGPELEAEFMEKVMPNSVATRWTPQFADVNCIGLSKRTGIEAFCRHFGIDLSETMSFGDGGNDISMLKSTAIGVAMGNANQEVKEAANYVTADVDDDGIWKALLYHKVI
jgi:hydroxymethylpyrimidine pyrophosphatase-like HAD family hydrolase